jgi:hypothetical protein
VKDRTRAREKERKIKREGERGSKHKGAFVFTAQAHSVDVTCSHQEKTEHRVELAVPDQQRQITHLRKMTPQGRKIRLPK